MKKQVLFIHRGGEGAYEADARLVASLQTELSADYAVRYPAIPKPQSIVLPYQSISKCIGCFRKRIANAIG